MHSEHSKSSDPTISNCSAPKQVTTTNLLSSITQSSGTTLTTESISKDRSNQNKITDWLKSANSNKKVDHQFQLNKQTDPKHVQQQRECIRRGEIVDPQPTTSKSMSTSQIWNDMCGQPPVNQYSNDFEAVLKQYIRPSDGLTSFLNDPKDQQQRMLQNIRPNIRFDQSFYEKRRPTYHDG